MKISTLEACANGNRLAPSIMSEKSQIHSVTPELLQLLNSYSRCAAETDEIINVEKIKPSRDVVSIRCDFLKCFVEILAALVVGRSAAKMKFRPIEDLPIVLFGMFPNPGQHLAVGFPVFQQIRDIFSS